MSIRCVVCFLLLWIPSMVSAEETSLSASETAVIGSSVDITWKGAGNKYDAISVVPSDSADDEKGIHTVKIINKRNPIALRMPEDPGSYELRYRSKADGTVLARRSISVKDVPTTLKAKDLVSIGASMKVTWEGPGNQYDRIELVSEAASPDSKAVATQGIVSKRNPVTLHLPDLPGRYEIRYVTREKGRILARRSLQIEDVASSLDAQEEASLGETIAIHWTGPGNQYDRIEVHEQGAADDARAVVTQAIVSKKNPVQIRLPEEVGDYEIRYETTRSSRILARRALSIHAGESEIVAPERATAGTTILVSWKGPGNDYDQIGIYPPDAADTAKPVRVQAILRKRNPIPLILPEEAGSYEIRYRTTQRKTVLARKAILVEPSGTLSVVFERNSTKKSAESGGGAIELILDASGSMLQREGKKRRIEIAREVLGDLVSNHLDDSRPFALRVFGHKEKGSCRTDLEIPLSKDPPSKKRRQQAVNTIASIQAMNLAKTPIADSLAQVPHDLKGVSGPKSVVLITDGEETCDGNPEAVISSLQQQGLDVQLSIVGFAVDDAALKKDFQTWATLGGGSYFDARSADELITSLRTVISGPYRVLNEEGQTVARGVIGGADIILPAGNYRVETIAQQPLVLDTVVIRAGEKTEASF